MSNKTLTLSTLRCNESSENHDEVYVVIQPDAGIPIRFPYDPREYLRMTGDIGFSFLGKIPAVPFEHEILVTIWDNDYPEDEVPVPSMCTYLGSHQYMSTDLGEIDVHLTNRNGADYNLTVNISNK